MWICLNDAFFSVVKKDCRPDEVMIRARREGDLEKVFNNTVLLSQGFKAVAATRYTKSDYLFRAPVKRDHLKAALAAEVDRIVYSNFKASTRDHDLHHCYNRMWHAHADMQELPPYSNGRPRAKTAPTEHVGSDGYGLFDDIFDANPKKAAAAVDKKAKKSKQK